MPKWSFLVSIILGLISTVVVDSMRFDLQSGTTKCISDDIKANAMTVGKYSAVNLNEGFPIPDSHKITVRVYSLLSLSIAYLLHSEFIIFMVCFWVFVYVDFGICLDD